MGNNTSVPKVIEISDSDNENEMPLQSNETTDNIPEKAVENRENIIENTLRLNEDNIIIDSDDEPDIPKKESIEEHHETYIEPEFINVELFKKIKRKTISPVLKTEDDKTENSKSNNISEETSVIKTLADFMETDEIKEVKLNDDEMGTSFETQVDSEIIDLDKNDESEFIKSLESNDISISLVDPKKAVSLDLDLESKNIDELNEADKSEEMFDVYVFNNKQNQNKADETKKEINKNEIENPVSLKSYVNEFLRNALKTDGLQNHTNNDTIESKDDVIDLDDCGGFETLADGVKETIATVATTEDNQPNLSDGCVLKTPNNNSNIMGVCSSESKNVEVNDEKINLNEKETLLTPYKTASTSYLVSNENIKHVSNCAEQVIDLAHAHGNKTPQTSFHDDSEILTQLYKANDNSLHDEKFVADLSEKNQYPNISTLEDGEIIDLDENDNDDKTQFILEEIKSQNSNNQDEVDVTREANVEHTNDVNSDKHEKNQYINIPTLEDGEIIDLDDNDNDDKAQSLLEEIKRQNSNNQDKHDINITREADVEHTNDVNSDEHGKNQYTNIQTLEDGEVIDLDENDNDGKAQSTSQGIKSHTFNNQNKDDVTVEDNVKPKNDVNSDELVMDIDAHALQPDIIDLDLENNEDKDGENLIATQINTEIISSNMEIVGNLQTMPVEIRPNTMEMEVQTEEKDEDSDEIVIIDNIPVEPTTNTIETKNIEAMSVETLPNSMEMDVQTQENDENDSDEIVIIDNIPVETTNTIETKSKEEMVESVIDTKIILADIPLHECVNYHCKRLTNITSPAPIFVMSFYRINKKSNKRQFVCEKCYDDCVEQYEQMTGDIIAHKPIIFKPESQPDLIELSDSDDDENGNETKRKNFGANKTRTYIENNESNRYALGNLEDLIEKAFSQINIDMQLKKRTDIINRSIQKNEASSTALFNEIRELQKSADKMHFTLYQKYPNRIIKELPPIDLNKEDILNLPPVGDINYPPIQIGKRYLGPRQIISGPWVECEALECYRNHPTEPRKHGTHWKVMFCRRATKLILYIKHLAYNNPPDVRLNVGTRVVAIFQQVPVPKQSFFPGTVGETLKDSNKYRYLIFFDDGYCQYVKHENVRLICEVSTNVWEDIDGNPGTSRFIQEFLTQFQSRISRPMLLAKRGQKIVTEFNGIWKLSKVVDVDCNLIKMYIEKNQTFEWIYRGSSRFAPIFKHRQIGSDLQLNAINYHLKKRNEPYIEMTLDEVSDGNYQSGDNNRATEVSSESKGLDHPTATRAVARKSTNNQVSKNQTNSNNSSGSRAPISLNNSVIVVDDDKMPKGKVTYYETTKRYSTTTYIAHNCTPACLVRVEDNLEPFNPIARPLLSGWERQICKYKSRKIAIYRAPCGRRLRTMLEVHRYLRLTESPLNVECFDYDTTMHCLAEYTDLPQYIRNTDLSDGTEKMPISCCNYFDKTTPPTCSYSTNRIPTEGVNLNLNPDFLCACDCEDDCIDKSKCQCWQLTIKGSCSINSTLPVDDIGYCFKRLLNPVPTGIYECNSRCKCKQNCLNRVVQHPLSVKLQVFKTTNRGWGLRTLHDIPKGSFICIYAGDLLTEQSSNELGAKEGDEYFAELDYIEAVEGLKEGYESDIPREEGDEEAEGEKDDDFENSGESDDDDFRSKCKAIDKKITTRSSTRSAKTQDNKKTIVNRPTPPVVPVPVATTATAEDEDTITISDDEEVRAPVNFIPNTSYDDDAEDDSKYKSVRKLFGKDELGYVMDAKRNGNIGRYFNHSCNPNLFVQNVFVDTHDLRFPWVTFFSNTSIQAGTELTWNYNYDVGCVPGKVLYCQCDSSNCRGRLL